MNALADIAVPVIVVLLAIGIPAAGIVWFLARWMRAEREMQLLGSHEDRARTLQQVQPVQTSAPMKTPRLKALTGKVSK